MVSLVPSLLEFGSPVWRDADALAPGFADSLAQALVSQDARASVLIAQSPDGAPLGFISLKVVASIGGGERGKVADLAVSGPARRLGAGTALMEAAEAWARERGLALLELDVWATNEKAQAFYRTLGFVDDSLTLVKGLT